MRWRSGRRSTGEGLVEPLLDLKRVRRRRGSEDGGFTLDIDRLAIRPGERIALIGDSGTGKSTCLDMLSLTLAPTDWERFDTHFDGASQAIGALWRRGQRSALAELRARYIGYVLQTGGLLPFLTVQENVALPRRLYHHDGVEFFLRGNPEIGSGDATPAPEQARAANERVLKNLAAQSHLSMRTEVMIYFFICGNLNMPTPDDDSANQLYGRSMRSLSCIYTRNRLVVTGRKRERKK